jgi:hypothetical protein
MNKRIILYGILIFFILAALGYARDFTFVNINIRLRDLWNEKNAFTFPDSLKFLQGMGYMQLYWLKWILTILASLLYLGIYILGVYLIFKKRKYILWTIACFAIVYLVSGLFYLSGYLVGNPYMGYHLARIFMGFIQSPFLFMLLIPAFLLSKKHENEENKE